MILLCKPMESRDPNGSQTLGREGGGGTRETKTVVQTDTLPSKKKVWHPTPISPLGSQRFKAGTEEEREDEDK